MLPQIIRKPLFSYRKSIGINRERSHFVSDTGNIARVFVVGDADWYCCGGGICPVYAAVFIIAFDVYWFFKTIYLSAHLRQSWKRMKHNIALDWEERLKNFKYDHIVHLVILPFYNEGRETIETGLHALIASKGDIKKIAVVLAAEERAGMSAQEIAGALKRRVWRKIWTFSHYHSPARCPRGDGWEGFQYRVCRGKSATRNIRPLSYTIRKCTGIGF